jgi:hypothetical protein
MHGWLSPGLDDVVTALADAVKRIGKCLTRAMSCRTAATYLESILLVCANVKYSCSASAVNFLRRALQKRYVLPVPGHVIEDPAELPEVEDTIRWFAI